MDPSTIATVLAGVIAVAAVSVVATRRIRSLRRQDELPVSGRVRTADTWMVIVAFGGVIFLIGSIVLKALFR